MQIWMWNYHCSLAIWILFVKRKLKLAHLSWHYSAQWCLPANYLTRKWNYISPFRIQIFSTWNIQNVADKKFLDFLDSFFLRYFKRSQKQSPLQWHPLSQLCCYEDDLKPRKMHVTKKSQDIANAKSRIFSCLRQREEKNLELGN